MPIDPSAVDAMDTVQLYAALPDPVWLTPREVGLYLDVTPELLWQWACRDRKDGKGRVERDRRGRYDLRSIARTLLARQT